MPLPQQNIVRGGPVAPLASEDVGTGEGLAATAIGTYESSLGASLGIKAIGSTASDPSTMMPHDVAAQQLKGQGYDPKALPEGDISAGTLDAIRDQQSAIYRNEQTAQAAHLGWFSGNAASFVGGAADPLFLLGSPALGKGLGLLTEAAGLARGLSLGGRLAVGGVEGGGLMAGYEAGKQQFGSAPGDRDISTYDEASAAAWGLLLGAGGKGAFGTRPVVAPTTENITLADIAARGERSRSDNDLSSKGARGWYQIMPETAKKWGTDPDELWNHDYNTMVAKKELDDIISKFPNDREAQAIAYDGGQGMARKFIRSNRDYSVLPKETQDYIKRLNGPTPDAVRAGASAAIVQQQSDSTVSVQPTIDAVNDRSYKTTPANIADEHDAEVSRLETEGMQAAVPKPDSIFTSDPDVQDRIAKTEEVAASAKQPTAETEPEAIHPELAKLVQNDVADAKALPVQLGQENTTLDDHLAAIKEQDAVGEQHEKVVEAAVRCGLMRGGLS